MGTTGLLYVYESYITIFIGFNVRRFKFSQVNKTLSYELSCMYAVYRVNYMKRILAIA